MNSYSTSELSRKSGDIIAEALRHPVAITQRKKARWVLLSIEDYHKLTTHRDTRRVVRIPEDVTPEMVEEIKTALEDYERENE